MMIKKYKNGKNIGHVTFFKFPTKIIITDVFVDKHHRKRGHGTKLVNAIIEYARKHKNVRKIELDDMSDIHGFNNIYYKCGFRYKNVDGPEMILLLK